MKDISKSMKFFEDQREKHHFSMIPIIHNYDDMYRNIFTAFASLSATIGAFSFLLFDSPYLHNIKSLVTGDVLLLIVIIISMFNYVLGSKRAHIDIINGYKRIQDRFDESINGYLEVLKGKIKQLDFEREQYEKAKEKVLSDKNQELPNYFWHYIVLIIFVFALIFVGISLINHDRIWLFF